MRDWIEHDKLAPEFQLLRLQRHTLTVEELCNMTLRDAINRYLNARRYANLFLYIDEDTDARQIIQDIFSRMIFLGKLVQSLIEV